jgi:hypothetical protein
MSAIAAISKCAKGLCGKDPGLTWKEAISLASQMYRNGEVAVAGSRSKSKTTRKKGAAKKTAFAYKHEFSSGKYPDQEPEDTEREFWNAPKKVQDLWGVEFAGTAELRHRRAQLLKLGYDSMFGMDGMFWYLKKLPTPSAKKTFGRHTDTASHNVNIRVVSGSRRPAATLTGKQLIAYADVMTTYEQWDYDAKPVKTIPQAMAAIKAAGMTVRKAGTKYKIS